MKKITNSLLLFIPVLLMLSCGGKKEEKVVANPKAIIDSAKEVIGIGKILPKDGILELAVLNTGLVQNIAVKEGDTVKKGQLILQLGAAEEQLTIAENNAQLATQRAKNESDALMIKSAAIKLQELSTKYETSKKLNQAGAETKEVLNTDYTAFVQQQQELAKAKQQLLINQKLLAELNEKLKMAQLNKSDKEVRAPKTGVILNLSIKMGQVLQANKAFGEFAAIGENVVECEVDELYADKVKEGNKVLIYAMGGTDSIAEGLVNYVGSALQNKSILYDNVGEGTDRRVRRITVTMTKLNKELLLNDKVECKILLK